MGRDNTSELLRYRSEEEPRGPRCALHRNPRKREQDRSSDRRAPLANRGTATVHGGGAQNSTAQISPVSESYVAPRTRVAARQRGRGGSAARAGHLAAAPKGTLGAVRSGPIGRGEEPGGAGPGNAGGGGIQSEERQKITDLGGGAGGREGGSAGVRGERKKASLFLYLFIILAAAFFL